MAVAKKPVKTDENGSNAHVQHPNPFSGVVWDRLSSHLMPGILNLDNISCRQGRLPGGCRRSCRGCERCEAGLEIPHCSRCNGTMCSEHEPHQSLPGSWGWLSEFRPSLEGEGVGFQGSSVISRGNGDELGRAADYFMLRNQVPCTECNLPLGGTLSGCQRTVDSQPRSQHLRERIILPRCWGGAQGDLNDTKMARRP